MKVNVFQLSYGIKDIYINKVTSVRYTLEKTLFAAATFGGL